MMAVGSTKAGLDRLENWWRWSRRGEAAALRYHFYPAKAAVCGDCVRDSGDVWADSNDECVPVDEADAEVVEKQVLALPIQLRKAVTCWYLGRPRTMGISEDVLREWVEQAARRIA